MSVGKTRTITEEDRKSIDADVTKETVKSARPIAANSTPDKNKPKPNS